MKWSLIALITVAVGLIGIAAWRGDGSVGAGFRATATTGATFLPMLAIAFLVMGFVEILLPAEVVEGWLSDASGWRGLALAWLAGVVTPAGSVIGLPLAASLAKAGVGTGVLVTYLTALACLSFIRMPLEIGFYGWRLTLIRIGASVGLPFVAGITARALATLWPAPP